MYTLSMKFTTQAEIFQCIQGKLRSEKHQKEKFCTTQETTEVSIGTDGQMDISHGCTEGDENVALPSE